MDMFDFNELVKRVIKYLVEGIVVALVAFAVPKKSLNVEEVVIIALTAQRLPIGWIIIFSTLFVIVGGRHKVINPTYC